MAQINYEVDLRSPECRNRSKIFKPKTCRILLYLLLLAILIAFCSTLEGYRLKLHAETEQLKSDLSAKTEAAAPLLELSAELETDNRRSAIAKILLSGYLIKADYLEKMIAAAPPGLSLSCLAIDAEGKIELKGNSPTLQSAALYAKELQELSFIITAELTTADLSEETGCYFSISANLENVSGGGEYEQ